MKELRDIATAYDEATRQGKRTALATVVSVEGSSYRRPGARMLVTEDGIITGAISGGCLEGNALRKAQLAIMQQHNRLVVYDTMDEDDLKFGVQLGCNGIVSILFEPVRQEDEHNPVALIRKALSERRDAVLVTAFGERTAADHGGTCGFLSAGEAVWTKHDAGWEQEAGAALRDHQSSIKPHGDHSVLFHFLPPAVQLVVAGAGNDAQPLVSMAAILGWDILVADGRATHALPQRFPGARQVIVARPEAVLQQVKSDAQTAFVLMTHNYNYDIALLEQLIAAPCGYIGVLGPKKKMQRMLDELAAKGLTIREEDLLKIYGPAGLDIGAEAAEEIALSIIAEIRASFAHRNGASLKFRTSPIYERTT